jgi:hypothetical protein
MQTVWQTVCVDFDGVIHLYSKGWADGTIYDPPVPGALAALGELLDRFYVVVYSSRNAAQIAEWLNNHGFHTSTDDPSTHALQWDGTFWDRRGVILVTNRKPGAVAYIDDRAIRFFSWPQALLDLDDIARREKD